MAGYASLTGSANVARRIPGAHPPTGCLARSSSHCCTNTSNSGPCVGGGCRHISPALNSPTASPRRSCRAEAPAQPHALRHDRKEDNGPDRAGRCLRSRSLQPGPIYMSDRRRVRPARIIPTNYGLTRTEYPHPHSQNSSRNPAPTVPSTNLLRISALGSAMH